MKQLLIIAILGCLGWNAQAEGTLRLLNTKFDHPQLRDWAAAHPSLVTAQLQRGLDVMGLQDAAGEGKLSQAADSLGLVHGFLTFDYRISGLLASFTEETASKLLPEIQQKMGTEYGVGAGQPYALLITWVSFQGKQLESLFYVNWQGFSRENEYSEGDKSFIKNAAAQTFYSGDEEVNGIFKISARINVSSLQMATVVMKFFLLLNDLLVEDAYFMVAGKRYPNNETLVICTCIGDPVQISVFDKNGNSFPSNTEWEGFPFFGRGPIAQFEDYSDAQTEYFVMASFKDNNIDYYAKLKVIVIKKVDYLKVDDKFFFDNNEINIYSEDNLKPGGRGQWQYELSHPKSILPKRWAFLLSGEKIKIKILTEPTGIELKELKTNTSGVISVVGSDEIELTGGRDALRNDGELHLPYLRCEKMELGIFTEIIETKLRFGFVIVNEENDDVQVTGVGKSGNVCVTAGPNNFLDTQKAATDQISEDGFSILPGLDGKCETAANNQNLTHNLQEVEKLIASAQSWVSRLYSKVGITITFLPSTSVTINYDRNRDGRFEIAGSRFVKDAQGNIIPNENLERGHVPYGTKYICIFHELSHTDNKGREQDDVAVSLAQFDMFIAVDLKDWKNRDPGWVIGHEIGHVQKLLHPWDDFINYDESGASPNDAKNVMNALEGDFFRKHQWAIMLNSVEPYAPKNEPELTLVKYNSKKVKKGKKWN